ncbi:MAG: Hsp20/alpha crystallin family protein [Alphaproteobacteria bacterium]
MLLTMGNRTEWNPFAELQRMQEEMNRMFSAFEDRSAPATDYPPTNVWVGDDSAVVTAELPGVSEKNIDLTVREDTLTLQGKIELDFDLEKVTWHRRERPLGTFSRTVMLPFRVDPNNVQATFTNGVLEVELKRPEADKPKRIAITAQ